jgi:glycosyltransferase involved in cell wall biosynthesis
MVECVKNEDLKVSLITVCFNSAETIRDTLESVRKQTYVNIEHIIVDGASSDNTMDIVQEYGHVSRVISEPDKGLYDAMNKGVELATGDLVGILNSDDFFESDDVVASVVETFHKNPESDMVFGDVVFVSPPDLDHVTRFYGAGHFRRWKLRFGWMPPHPATFVRKSAYEMVGGYRLDMQIAADYEMFVRWLIGAGLAYSRVNKVLVRMRAGGVSTANLKSRITLNREIVKACRENGLYTNLLFVLSKVPFKLFELIRKPG